MLKKELAPIPKEAWEEINDRAEDVLKTYLSSRKVVNVNGPKGWDYTVVSEGRLETIDDNSDVCHGLYKVKPLVEARTEFEMNKWELDNIVRGAKDIDLEPLEEAVKEIALFEENAIYNGLKTANIEGLMNTCENNEISFGKDGASIMEAISKGIVTLKEAYAEKSYTLVVGEEAWKRLNKEINGVPLLQRIKDLLGNEVVYSHVIDGALLLPYDHEDLEMTIGKDFSVGYQASDMDRVRFFITESFTFRILDPAIIVKFTV